MSRIVIDTTEIPIENIKDIIIRTNDGKYYELKSEENQFMICYDCLEVDLSHLQMFTCEAFIRQIKSEYEKALLVCKTIELDISSNYFRCDEIIKVFEYLESMGYHHKITKLSIHHNRLEQDGMGALLDFIVKCPLIISVDAAINLVNNNEFNKLMEQKLLDKYKDVIYYSCY